MGIIRIGYFSSAIAFLLAPINSQAQCLSGNCYAFADASSLQICEGQSVTLHAEGGSAALYNNFNSQTVGTGWITNNINVQFTNPCGVPGADGTTYLWFGNTSGAGQRILTTADFNLTGGGTMSFDLRFSIQGAPSPCEGPDLADEGVYFQYSTNYGSTWNTIFYFDPNIGGSAGTASSPYTNWANYNYAIPAGAQTPCTRFRWYQEVVSGEDFDHWGLDNVFIGGPPPNPGSVTFQWLDGVSALPPRVVTPADDTQYILMYGNSNDTCYDTLNVVVFDVPEASLVVSPMQACMGTAIQFDASGSNSGTTAISNYKWIFNNSGVVNQTTTVPNTTFTFPITGTFNTSVIVTAGICRDTATVPVTVSMPPNAIFTYPTQVCEDALVTLNATGSTIAPPGIISTYAWDYGNDGTTEANQQVVGTSFGTPGAIPIKLTVTSAAGCSSSVTHTVNVYDIPQAAFTYNDACIGAATVFQNTTTGTATQYAWDFNGLSSSAVQNPSYVFPGAGTYTVSMVANNGNVCYDSSQATFEIKNTVTADFSFNQPCTLEGIYTDLSSVPVTSEGGITGWNWSFGDGNQGTDQHATHVYPANSIYSVTLIVETDKGCLDTVTYQVPRYAVPEANFEVAGVCLGQITAFNNTSSVSSGMVASSDWTFGEGGTSDNFAPSYSYDTFGMFPVTLWVETENGCRDSVSENYEVYPQPVADYEPTPAFTDMLSPDVQFTDMSQYAENWYWTFGTSGSSADQNPLYTFTSSGSYTITLVVTNQYGCKASVTYPYEVLPAYNFYVPASFTPFNGDSLNTNFRVYHTGVKEMYFMIYSSWGQQLLYTNDPQFMWDGKFEGKALPQGTYVYRAWVRNVEGKQYEYTGHIVMLY